MFYHLPPVGNPICLSTDATTTPVLTTEKTHYYDSGTAALAAAITAAITRHKMAEPSSQTPEVILPAYACPDLLSAIVFCDARPVLVDITEDRPWLDLTQLASAITKNTVAVVAVSLFGIPERWQQLREVVSDENIVLIEDSAQYFPGADEPVDWQGDLVIFSFGRGKPVSLLGGGAVLCQKMDLYDALPEPPVGSIKLMQRLTYNMKAGMYNAVISPRLYWLLQSLPFLHLGETRYHKLYNIAAMDPLRLRYLARNVLSYQNDDMALQRNRDISSMLDSIDNVVNLPQVCKLRKGRRLLRYPVLLDEATRDHCFQELAKAGLGASILYPASLPNIDGVDAVLSTGSLFPNASAFASSLLTLPTHTSVSVRDINKMKSILAKFTR